MNQQTVLEGYNKVGKSIISSSYIGRGTYIGHDCKLGSCTIGRFCSIGSNVKVLSATHPTSLFVSTHPSFFSVRRQAGFSFVSQEKFKETLFINENKKTVVEIGNDVWIGDDVTIIGGIKIGDGAVVATGAVVTKDILPYSIVGGVPAKEIKKRFDDCIIEKLEQLKWWNRDMKWLSENASTFNDVYNFVNVNR